MKEASITHKVPISTASGASSIIAQATQAHAPLRIAIDIREAGHEKTGKGWYTYNLVQALLEIDSHNEYILYTDQEKNSYKEFKNAHIKTVKGKSVIWHLNVLKDLKKSPPVDIFFAPTSYIIPCFAPKNLRVIITVHDLVAFLFPGSHNSKAVLIERVTLRKALKKAANVLVVSANTEKDLLDRFHYPKEKIHEVPCATTEFYKEEIGERELTAFKKKHHLPDKFILAVGTLEPRKNFSTLIKSFVIVKRKYPDCKLVIVGKKGWKYKLIEEALKKYQLESDVIFPGYLVDEDLRKMYHLASVFVFPSLYEGFGIPPLEAMACGCPVVSSNVASLPEVIGDSGLLIDPKNAHKWADAVCSLLDNEQTRNMLIERGHRRAEKFSWANSAKIALEVFESYAR
ncbi:MAG: glycosyltransferase family 1 protein [Candidatus Gracilibacteria bacterium]|jgi:glycosyltransferase involved in cell wall biosynthesis